MGSTSCSDSNPPVVSLLAEGFFTSLLRSRHSARFPFPGEPQLANPDRRRDVSFSVTEESLSWILFPDLPHARLFADWLKHFVWTAASWNGGQPRSQVEWAKWTVQESHSKRGHEPSAAPPIVVLQAITAIDSHIINVASRPTPAKYPAFSWGFSMKN